MDLESVLGTLGVNWEDNTDEIQHQLYHMQVVCLLEIKQTTKCI